MSLIELSLNTTHEAVDWVWTLLADTIDIGNVQITKYAKTNLSEQDWTFTICLYVPNDIYSRTRIEKIVNLLSPLHRTGLATAIQTTVIEEKPQNADILNPLIHRMGNRFIVLTPNAHYQSQATDEIILRLPTSLSFGSGLHPATILSLQLLERYIVPMMNVLDLGSGSGILSVAMAKLGAQVLALDNDNIAVQATQDAVCVNSVEERVTVMQGSLGCGSDMGHWMSGNTLNNVSKVAVTDTFDLIIANILARVHIALVDDYRRSLRQSNENAGILITSGFTSDHEEDVVTTLTEVGFEVIDCDRLNEWVAYAYRLKV